MTAHDTTQPNLRFSQVGKSLTRTDAPGKTTGRTPYAGDYVMPGMLHAKVLRADIASARLKRLDVSKARALPGVACVLTAADMPDRTIATDIPGQTGRDRLKTDQQILVKERVRYFGEPLALIAAETADIAEKARRLIEFELEPIPGVYDPEEAMKPGAPVVQGTDNVVATHKIRKGDSEAGFAAADAIVENTYVTPFQEHAFLEPEVGLAWIDENEVITIRVSTQVIEHFRAVADAVGVPHNKLRIMGALVGGGFGGKEDVTVETYLAVLAQKTRKPVRLEFSREDSFVGHGNRHAMKLKYRTGVTRDGRITALDVQVIADAGAYVYLSPYVLLYCAVNAPGPYRVDNLNVFARAVATNNMFTSAFRGFGGIQAAAAYEQQMDEAARAIGMDPLEFRRRNYLQTGDAISTGFVPPSAIWTEKCADLAWQALGEPTPAPGGSVRIGRGIAACQQSYGRLTFLHDTSEAWVGIEMDGTVTVRSGVTDIGAGQASSLAQIAAEVLGVTLPNVTVYNSDSQVTPLAGTTTASRALYMTGNAARLAAQAVRDRLADVAAELFGAAPAQIGMEFNRVFVTDDPERCMGLAELVKVCASRGVHRSELAIFRAPFTDVLDPETGQGQAHPDYAYGAHAIEVAVDTETGEVTVLKSVAAHDVGQCINRAAVEGQIHGGVQNGLGYALSEEMLYKEGRLITPSFSEYLMPTAMDMPPVESIILESRSGLGPFGAKGIGEPSMTPVAPAVANAIADAIGVRVFEMPITPERIWRALEAARA
ncbi:xanthine dehydrogenase family protein molybdopterin-binding subunit [Defluviimonas sp. SAOS-178_SWC]|uniref:xanthine dehydrogenase family protein molybdopterin-binding subunit n=1 Tax=Defluviimonas sp. SAOS-178_SWC TaxID=3121287 RepID=UPI0032221037